MAALMLAMGLNAASAQAQTAAGAIDDDSIRTVAPPPEPVERTPGPVSIDGGFQAVSQYIARGVTYARPPSIQPFASVSLALPNRSGSVIKDSYISVGTWNSLQADDPGSEQRNDGSFKGWYENDYYLAVGTTVADKLHVSASYFRYTAPANAYRPYGEFQIGLKFDDSSWWSSFPLRDFSLSPNVLIAREQNRRYRKDALYIEPSLTPSFNIGSHDRPVRLSVPLAIALSDNYFDGKKGGKKTYGFFRTGVLVSAQPNPTTLPWLTLDSGVDLWLPNASVASGLHRQEVVAHIGMSFHLQP